MIVMYVVTALIYILILITYVLANKLYKEPKNSVYYSNVGHYNVIKKREIMASPKYVTTISILLGIFIGIYVVLAKVTSFNYYIEWGTIIILMALYLVEITRKISITDENIELEKLFAPTKKIPLGNVDGMYIYSFNKKFLNKRAFTTKLVIASGEEKYKFTISSIDVKAIMNMMKDLL